MLLNIFLLYLYKIKTYEHFIARKLFSNGASERKDSNKSRKENLKYKTKNFKKNRFFILYDVYDNPVLLIDSWEDLVHVYHKRIKDIVYRFNNTSFDYIPVIIDGTTYKLYTFEE